MFYDQLLKLCKEKGVKPTPVIKELNISTGTLSQWKNGAIPNGATLKKLADYFNVTVDELLGREPTVVIDEDLSNVDLTGVSFAFGSLTDEIKELDDEDLDIVKSVVKRLRESKNNENKAKNSKP